MAFAFLVFVSVIPVHANADYSSASAGSSIFAKILQQQTTLWSSSESQTGMKNALQTSSAIPQSPIDIPVFNNLAASGTSIPVTPDDLNRILYVTSDFQLLPASAMSHSEELAADIWDFNNGKGGHLLELIPRPGGYEVTIQRDDGTTETKFFTEFSNGQPFPPPIPGSRDWEYMLSPAELKAAMTLYGQKMTLGQFLEKVAPQELNNMDDTLRALAYMQDFLWPDQDFVQSGRPWVMGLAISFGYQQIPYYSTTDVGYPLPDLSDVPIGSEMHNGPGWNLTITVYELTKYSSMGDLYRSQFPDIWNSFSADEKSALDKKSAKVADMGIARVLRADQRDLVRKIWGTPMTNAEYFSTVWPDLWAAVPSWEKNTFWANDAYPWRDIDLAEHFIPEDYVEHSVNNVVTTVKAAAPTIYTKDTGLDSRINMTGGFGILLKNQGHSGIDRISVELPFTSNISGIKIPVLQTSTSDQINQLTSNGSTGVYALQKVKPAIIFPVTPPLVGNDKISGISAFGRLLNQKSNASPKYQFSEYV